MIKQLQGDTREVIKTIPSESVDVAITSPPYYNQRDYGTGEWVGGDKECNHNSHKDPVKKALSKTTLEGSLTRQLESAIASTMFKGTCGKCGAKKVDKQIGLEKTPEDFTQQMFDVFMETKRILKPHGTLWINLGDSYCSTAPGTKAAPLHIAGLHKDTADSRSVMRPATPASLKPKDLIGIPWRIAFALQGFAVVPFYKFSEWADLLAKARETNDWELVTFVENILRSMDLMTMLKPYWHRCDIIWAKPNPMPESVNDRPTKSHEYIFLLTKNAGKPLFWTHREKDGTHKQPKPDYRWINNMTDAEESVEPVNWQQKIKCPICAGKGKVQVDYGNDTMPHEVTEQCDKCDGKKEISLWERVNMWEARDYYYDAEAIKTENKGSEHDKHSRVNNKRFPTDKVNGIRNPGYYPMANKRSVWSITTSAYKEDHYATFPPSLIVDCIRAGTSEHGNCAECGSPYTRVIKKVGVFTDPRMKSNRSVKVAEQYRGESSAQGMFKSGQLTVNETAGWRRTCACETKLVKPAVVFDPFSGTGTTLEVAEKLGRDSLGIELSKKNIKLASKRQHRAFGLFLQQNKPVTENEPTTPIQTEVF